MSRIDSLQRVTRGTFLFAYLRGSKRKSRDFLRNTTFMPILDSPQCLLNLKSEDFPEFWEIIWNFLTLSLKKKNTSQACTCTAVLAKNV